MEGFPKIDGFFLGGSCSKDYRILGSTLASLYLWKLPYIYVVHLTGSEVSGILSV